MFQRLCQHTGNLLKRGQRYFCNDAKTSSLPPGVSPSPPLSRVRDTTWTETFAIVSVMCLVSFVQIKNVIELDKQWQENQKMLSEQIKAMKKALSPDRVPQRV